MTDQVTRVAGGPFLGIEDTSERRLVRDWNDAAFVVRRLGIQQAFQGVNRMCVAIVRAAVDRVQNLIGRSV